MLQYKVRSGQNIYDVALTLYGGIEGVFDLLASNKWLTMETRLAYGMVLNYNEEYVINQSLAMWLKDKNILVKNGDHTYEHLDVESFIEEHIKNHHQDIYNSLTAMSPDERNMFWELLYTPKMIIRQRGRLSAVNVKLKAGKHLIIDWGDYTAPQIVESPIEVETEHCYKSQGEHIITFYGDFECDSLDLSKVNGIHYPLGSIFADKFTSALKIDDLNKLIIQKCEA